jgi:hypothetical protein
MLKCWCGSRWKVIWHQPRWIIWCVGQWFSSLKSHNRCLFGCKYAWCSRMRFSCSQPPSRLISELSLFRKPFVMKLLHIFHASSPGFPLVGQCFRDLDGFMVSYSNHSSRILVPSVVVISDKHSTCKNKRQRFMSICCFLGSYMRCGESIMYESLILNVGGVLEAFTIFPLIWSRKSLIAGIHPHSI